VAKRGKPCFSNWLALRDFQSALAPFSARPALFRPLLVKAAKSRRSLKTITIEKFITNLIAIAVLKDITSPHGAFFVRWND
jgi:hypothetical protein